jgi:ribonuclease P protein component
MAKKFSYNSTEKLKSRKQLDALFTKGRSVSVFPIKVFFAEVNEETDASIKAGVGVSSKHFKKAVDRNRIKRLLREAYRLNKIPLTECVQINNKKIAIFFLFIDKAIPAFSLLQNKMPIAIEKLIKALNENNTANT